MNPPNEETIKQIKENLFYRSQKAISDYTVFDWHISNIEIDTCRINSSQALTIDFWGCLRTSPDRNFIINNLFSKSADDWTVEFEFSDRFLLSEIRPTQVDVILESNNNIIIIESKFTEKDGGGCSQINKTKNGLIQCNGNYEDQINPVNNRQSKCSLTGKGIEYWNYINKLTLFDNSKDYLPCPFKYGEFQWMRNICFSDAYAKKQKKTAECYLAYYKSEKCSISKKVDTGSYLGKLKDMIIPPHTFKPISYNDLLSDIIKLLDSVNPEEQQVWIDLQNWMTRKEGKL